MTGHLKAFLALGVAAIFAVSPARAGNAGPVEFGGLGAGVGAALGTAINATGGILTYGSTPPAFMTVLPSAVVTNATVAGSGFVPLDTVTFASGSYTTPAVATVLTTGVSSVTLVSGGSGGSGNSSSCTFVGTTGLTTGPRTKILVTMTGGTITAINGFLQIGTYNINPTNIAVEPLNRLVGCPGVTGVTVSLTMGPRTWIVPPGSGGLYTSIPTNPVTPSATSGVGTGASFALPWGYAPPPAPNSCLGIAQGPFTATGASGTGTTATVTFTSTAPAIPVGTLITITGLNPSAYNGTFTVTASASGSVSFASTTTAAYVSAGAVSVTFPANVSGATCVNGAGGNNITNATNNVFLSGPGVGSNVFSSGYDVFMMGNGLVSVDAPAPYTAQYFNVENLFIANTVVPTLGSGFGTGAGPAGGTTGGSTQVFGWNLGTGATASSGVLTFQNAAPNGWHCEARDTTNPGSFVFDVASTSPTSVTLTSYSRTTGMVAPWTSGDVAQFSCKGF